MAPRKAIPLSVKLAAALLAITDKGGAPLIPFRHAKDMSTEQILSLFDWDHYPIPHAEEGPDEPWNLVPRFKPEHREKTARVDVPQIAKGKRIRKKEAAHQAIMAGETVGPGSRWLQQKAKWPSRPFNRSARPKPRPTATKVLPRRLTTG